MTETTTTSSEDTEQKLKQLTLAMEAINRDYGKGSIMRLGSAEAEPWPAISTGALTLDLALGIGGLPLGRIVEVYGPESSGKSTVCLTVIAEAQKQGKICAFIDVEHAVDPAYAKALGVNMDDLLFSQPDYGEMALDIVDKLIKTGDVDVIVVDSVAALTPKAELDGDMSTNHMGLQSRMMGQVMRKIVANASKNKTLVLFTNQIREKLGIMFGNPETTPGGRALKFYASVRLDLRKMKENKNTKDGSVEGIKVKAKVIKNKMAPPLKIAEFDIIYGYGVNTLGCIVDEALSRGILKQSGSWVKDWNGESFAQGRDNAVLRLTQDLELADKIRDMIFSD